MFYKGIIFDLDNTLYSYTECHERAITECFTEILKINPTVNIFELKKLYNKISLQLKNELHQTASSHNKSIYIKKGSRIIKYWLSIFFYVKSIILGYIL